MKERNITLDIMKGIGIILMVIGHAGCPSFLRNFIYTFHMPLFFMISGYLVNGNKPQIIKRIKALYYPFLFWGLLSLALSYPLYISGINPSPYNLNEYITHLIKIITFAQPEPISGPLWFLKSLFLAYIFISIIIWKTKGNKYQNYIISLLCFIMLCLGFILYEYKGWLPYNIQRELMIPWLIYLGYIIKQNPKPLPFILIILSFIVLLLSGQYVTLELIASKIGNPIFLTIYALMGFIMVYSTSYRIQQLNYKFTSLLVYIGRNTMPILILHLACFKLTQFVLSYLTDLDFQPDHIYLYYSPYWPLYSIMGIGIPLILNFLYLNIKK